MRGLNCPAKVTAFQHQCLLHIFNNFFFFLAILFHHSIFVGQLLVFIIGAFILDTVWHMPSATTSPKLISTIKDGDGSFLLPQYLALFWVF